MIEPITGRTNLVAMVFPGLAALPLSGEFLDAPIAAVYCRACLQNDGSSRIALPARIDATASEAGFLGRGESVHCIYDAAPVGRSRSNPLIDAVDGVG